MKIGFTGLLTLLFVGLKLTGFITWSWLWVLSPIWISLLLFALVMLGAFSYYMYKDIKSAKR